MFDFVEEEKGKCYVKNYDDIYIFFLYCGIKILYVFIRVFLKNN